MISEQNKSAIQDVLDKPLRKYRTCLDRFAVEGDRVCYPGITTALGKAEAEIELRRNIPRKVRGELEKASPWATAKLRDWQRDLDGIEVPGQRNLYAGLRHMIQQCNGMIDSLDSIPAQLEQWIEKTRNPSSLGSFVIENVARADWNALVSLLSRAGTLEAETFLASIKEMKAGIENLQVVVQRNLDAGRFRKEPGRTSAPRDSEDGPIRVRDVFDARDLPRRI